MLRAAVVALAISGLSSFAAEAECAPIVSSANASIEVCDGPLPGRAATDSSTPAPTPASTTETPPTLDGQPIPDRNGNGVLDCPDFTSWDEANRIFAQTSGDPFHLDGDGDGVPCESLPGAPST